MVVAGGFQIGASLEHGMVHGKIRPSQMTDEKVDDKYVGNGQNGLDPMDPESDIESPAGHEPGGPDRIRQENAGAADNHHPPEHRPVIEFFPVPPPLKFGMSLCTEHPRQGGLAHRAPALVEAPGGFPGQQPGGVVEVTGNRDQSTLNRR